MAFSTGVSLLTATNRVTLTTSLRGWWDFENTLNSSHGGSQAFSWVGENGPTGTSVYDIGTTTTSPKIGSYSGYTYEFRWDAASYTSIRPSNTLNKTSGTIFGWVKILTRYSTTPVPEYVLNFSLLNSLAFNADDSVGNMGVKFNSSSINSTSVPTSFVGGSTLTNVDMTQWTFVCYWWDYSDTSQGVNGSQYFQINNGTVYGAQTPTAIPAGSLYLQAVSNLEHGYYDSAAGSDGSGYYYGNGIDSTAIYDRTLSTTERSSIYNSGTGINYSQMLTL